MRRAYFILGLALATAACGAPAPQQYAAKTEAVLHASIVSTTTPDFTRYEAEYTSSTGPDGAPNCRVAAAKGNSSLQRFVIAGPGSKQAPLYFGLQTRDFTGPGVYESDQVRIDSVAAVIERQTVEFRRGAESAVRMTIAPDGSGIATFSGFRSAEGTSLSTTVTWRCATRTVNFPV